MRALLAVNPDHAEALNFVGYAYAEQGVRLEEAERLVRRALELKPRSGHILDSLGWVLFRRGDPAPRGGGARAGRGARRAPTRRSSSTSATPTAPPRGSATRRRPTGARSRASRGAPSERGKRRAALERKLREVAERAGRR